MKYTVYVGLSFDKKDEAVKLLNYIEKIKGIAYDPKTTDMQPLQLKTELWETRHDENPPKQCNVIDRVDFDKAEEATHV